MKSIYNMTFAVLVVISLAGCATAKRQSDIGLDQSAKNTDFGIVARQDGFEIELRYARYQFIPESDAVAIACKTQLLALAYKHADSENRQIQPINEQRISMSMGRNGLTGITSCRAHGVAIWK